MTEYLPEDVLVGLRSARRARQTRRARLRVMAGGHEFFILRSWPGGFALDADKLDADKAPHLRGLVDIFDGPRHVSQCLIVASDESDGEMRFEFKRSTVAADRAPLDFVPDRPERIALPEN